MTINREAYDALLQCEDTLQQLVGNHPSGLMSVALLAVHEARRELTPTVWTSDIRMMDRVWAKYPRCTEPCRAAGQWGGSGRMPVGHVLVRWGDGNLYLAHDREAS